MSVKVYSSNPKHTKLHSLISIMMDVSDITFLDEKEESPDNYINIVVNRVFIDVGVNHSCFDGKAFDKFHRMCKMAFKKDHFEMYMEDPLPEDEEYAYEVGYDAYYERYSI